MSEVREARFADLYRLMALSKQFNDEAPSNYEWDEAKIKELLSTCMSDTERCLYVLKGDKDIHGFVAGLFTETLFNRSSVVSELAWFVEAGYRGKGQSMALIDALSGWGKEKGANYIALACIEELADMGPLYKKLGYKLTESTYTKAL
jgi:GNAT superfamily N-acetyltransferase